MPFGYLIIKTDNSITFVESENEKFSLDELYQAIDCSSIALIKMENRMMCCDDDAIGRGRDLNLIASCLVEYEIFGDVILGANEHYFRHYMEPDIYKLSYSDCLKDKDAIERLHLAYMEQMEEKRKAYYYSLCPLPAVPEDLPEDSEKEIYKVVTCDSSAIAVFDDYSLAVGLIELIEKYCESKGLKNVYYS